MKKSVGPGAEAGGGGRMQELAGGGGEGLGGSMEGSEGYHKN